MADTSRIWGGLFCLAMVIAAVVFLWGIAAQSYWAVAIPVMIGFLGLLSMGFWIGWTILTIKTAPPVSEPGSSPPRDEPKSSPAGSSPAEKGVP